MTWIIKELKRLADFLENRCAEADELEFISRIKRDGSGVEPVSEEKNKKLQSDVFGSGYTLTRLSITEDTYIASAFNSYVVKRRKQ